MRLILFSLLFLFISPCIFAQLSNGLVAHWNFNGNANDVSGNNLNGTVTGATLTAGYSGVANTAYQFNGTNDHIDVAYNSLMNLDSFSVCTFIKPMGFYSGVCQGNFILARGVWVSSPSDFYYLSFDDNAWDNSCSIYTLSHEVFDVNAHASSAPPGSSWYTNADTVALNTWYCVIGTYQHDSVKLYIDGTLRKTLYFPDNYAAASDIIGIGYNPLGVSSGYPCWFNGVIDDIRLYNRALSDAEVTQYCDSVISLIVQIDTSVAIDSVSNFVLCAGSSFNVFYSVSDTFQMGNIFTVQLSNSLGSFSSPVTIGSVTASIAGIITCTIPTGSPPGTGYKIRIVASSPAYASADTSLTISTGSLAAPAASNNSPICAGQTLQLNGYSGASGVTYSWTGPNNFASSSQDPTIVNAPYSAAGTYTLTISSMGCTNSANTIVIIYPNEMPAFTISGNACVGASLNVIANNISFNPAYYNWNFGTADVHSGTGAGAYIISWNETGNESITLAYTGNCQQADTQSIVIHPLPVDHIVASNVNICSGDTLTIQPQADSLVYTYKWAATNAYISNINAAITAASFSSPGNIYMYISTQYSCTSTDSLYINAQPCCTIFVPNAFSPNGDSKNDEFRARSVRPFDSYQLMVFNRWGQEVFSTKEENEGWNGQFKGTQQEIGVYFYYIKYTCAGKELTKKGDVTLLR